MNTLKEILHNPTYVIAAFWVYSAAVQAMPRPDANSGKFYRWFYSFLQSMAANIDRLAEMKGINPPVTLPPKS